VLYSFLNFVGIVPVVIRLKLTYRIKLLVIFTLIYFAIKTHEITQIYIIKEHFNTSIVSWYVHSLVIIIKSLNYVKL